MGCGGYGARVVSFYFNLWACATLEIPYLHHVRRPALESPSRVFDPRDRILFLPPSPLVLVGNELEGTEGYPAFIVYCELTGPALEPLGPFTRTFRRAFRHFTQKYVNAGATLLPARQKVILATTYPSSIYLLGLCWANDVISVGQLLKCRAIFKWANDCNQRRPN